MLAVLLLALVACQGAEHPDGEDASGTEAVDHLLTTLGEVLHKPGGIELIGPREVPGHGRTWTVDALRALLDEHRRERSDEQRMTMAVLAVAVARTTRRTATR